MSSFFNGKHYLGIARSVFYDAAIHSLHWVTNNCAVMDRFAMLVMTALILSAC